MVPHTGNVLVVTSVRRGDPGTRGVPVRVTDLVEVQGRGPCSDHGVFYEKLTVFVCKPFLRLLSFTVSP